MKYFFDTEFIEDGRTIDLISIGVVCDDGRELYLCNADCDLSRASHWVIANVIPHLPPCSDKSIWFPKSVIAGALGRFAAPETKPEFWAYYADYDWVALCQLFGRMIDLPSHFPMWCRDLKQLSWSLGSPKHPKQESTEHNALDDARWNRDLYRMLMAMPAADDAALLWQMLDDIDTLGDVMKPTPSPYFEAVNRIAARRHDILKSDGYNLSRRKE